jgi:hypothetical protein
MTVEQMVEKWKEFDDKEGLNFSKVSNKRANRADLHAFLLLDELCPSTIDIVDAAEHDIIFPRYDESVLANRIMESQIQELSRCGVFWSTEYDCLAMFV